MEKNKGVYVYIFFFLAVLNCAGQDTVYIDPENTGDPQTDGSFNHPYPGWDDFEKKDSTTYLIKRGTVLEVSEKTIIKDLQSSIIGAYGSGERPRIETNAVVVESCKNLVIKDLEIYADGGHCMEFSNFYPSKNVLIDNCVIHSPPDWEPGTYNYGISAAINGLKIYNTEIYDIYRDGLYFSYANNVEIKGCYIHDVNQYFFDDPDKAGGDGIQFVSTDSVFLRETTIDRSGTGKKFCVIIQNPDDDFDVTHAIFEDNHFIGPDITEYGGASLFIGVKSIIIRRNIIENAPSGVYTHAHEITINNNLFLNNGGGVSVASNSANIYNNVFYGNGLAVHSSHRPSIIKNNIVYLTDSADEGFNAAECDVSNNIQNINSTTSPWFDAGTITDPMFVDVADGDFHLEKNSPCIDSGVDVGIDIDFDRNKIPCNGLPDIGAYEYQYNCDSIDNHRPVANAGEDISVYEEEYVELDGTESYDPDGDSLSFVWETPDKLNLSDYTDSVPSFYAPANETGQEENYYISLIVEDGFLKSASDTMKLVVMESTQSALNDRINNAMFDISPNPVLNDLYIYFNGHDIVKELRFLIYSVQGTLVKTHKHVGVVKNGSRIHLNLEAIPMGVYVLTIESEGKLVFQSKITKN
jgi:hypothetical protein